MSNSRIIEVGFAELSDGSPIEVIEHPRNSSQRRLAVCRGQSVLYYRRFADGNRILVPLSSVGEDEYPVQLAEGVQPFAGTIQNLEIDIKQLFRECLDLDRQWPHLLTAFAICTWFPERLGVAPYLAFVGPPSSGKTTAMKVLAPLCYRGLLTSEISSAAFYDVCDRMHPTIFIDETLTAGSPRELRHLLRASSTPGFATLRKGKARFAYGPKVFSWIELPADAALNSRCLIVPMRRTIRTNLTSPDDPSIVERARVLRRKLQYFRLQRYKHLVTPKVPAGVTLNGRSLDLYRALALPFHADRDMCDLLAYGVADQSSFQTMPLSPTQASVMSVLFWFIHAFPDVAFCPVAYLTAGTNEDLKERGESAGLNERKVGDVLTSLGFTNRVRRNTGFILWLVRSDRFRIHTMARDYGVDAISVDSVENCEMCHQLYASRSNVPNARIGNPSKYNVAAS